MKIKAAGLILGTSLFALVGQVQASSCMNHQPGWHMVPKHCNIKPAESWQEYTGGVYTQPITGKSMFFMMNR